MKKKMVLAAALIAFVAFSASAEMGMYFKGMYGRGFRTRDWNATSTEVNSSSTTNLGTVYAELDTIIIPSFGITPWAGSGNAFLSGLSFEFGLELGMGSWRAMSISSAFGGTEIDQVFAVTPSVMVVYGHKFGKAVPYVGVGVAVPIVIVDYFNSSDWNYSGTYGNYTYGIETDVAKVGVNANLMAGVGYAVSESFMPVFELGYGVGMGQGFSARIGAVFTIKDGGRGGNPPPPPPPPAEDAAEE